MIKWAHATKKARPDAPKRRSKVLVLSRKPNESIIVNGDIKITVVELKGGRVRLGIEAPRDVPIFREEIQERIEAASSGE